MAERFARDDDDCAKRPEPCVKDNRALRLWGGTTILAGTRHDDPHHPDHSTSRNSYSGISGPKRFLGWVVMLFLVADLPAVLIVPFNCLFGLFLHSDC